MKQKTRDFIEYYFSPFMIVLGCRILSMFKSAKYKVGKNDYDAAGYWNDRHAKFGKDRLAGVGMKSMNEAANLAMYESARYIFSGMVNDLDIPRSGRVFELGFGVGFYTGIIKSIGFKDYYGADIASVHIDNLNAEYPEYFDHFFICDVGTEIAPVEGVDFAFMIDVSQHIINDNKLRFALKKNVQEKLNPGGYFIVTDSLRKTKRSFYEHYRTMDFYNETLNEMKLWLAPVSFRDKYIFTFRKC